MKNTYNGWPNYETWNVMLWMDNEEPAYRAYCAAVRASKRDRKRFRGPDAQAITFECFGTSTPDKVSLYSSKIRWGKIAESMRESA